MLVGDGTTIPHAGAGVQGWLWILLGKHLLLPEGLHGLPCPSSKAGEGAEGES